ncbi:MAG: hypothetical protein HFG80_11560 [Eubacterium sp.]|nr:hypothetical protein [Eubacterium sp.]
MENARITSTPYDDVFRTLLNDCSPLIIPLINEVFGEHYSGQEKIVFSPNEHFLNQQGGNEDERITDTSFKIIGKETKKYHLECQSSTDNSILVRFFEYDTQIALDEGSIKDNILTVTLPHSAILFLRHHTSTPDTLTIRMVTPGGIVEYDIQVIKSQQYTLKEIFEKNLLLLIPFYIFSHETRFAEYEQNKTKLGTLQEEYEQIKNNLENLLKQRAISEYTRCTIIDMSNKVLEHIAVKYKSVKEGVKAVMGGKILEYEAKTIKREGIEQGIEKGIEKGIEGTVSILKNLGVPTQTILAKIQEQYKLSPEASKKYL